MTHSIKYLVIMCRFEMILEPISVTLGRYFIIPLSVREIYTQMLIYINPTPSPQEGCDVIIF